MYISLKPILLSELIGWHFYLRRNLYNQCLIFFISILNFHSLFIVLFSMDTNANCLYFDSFILFFLLFQTSISAFFVLHICSWPFMDRFFLSKKMTFFLLNEQCAPSINYLILLDWPHEHFFSVLQSLIPHYCSCYKTFHTSDYLLWFDAVFITFPVIFIFFALTHFVLTSYRLQNYAQISSCLFARYQCSLKKLDFYLGWDNLLSFSYFCY